MVPASCLVDTNILLRVTRCSDPQHHAVDTALAHLAEPGTTLYYTHQNIAELRKQSISLNIPRSTGLKLGTAGDTSNFNLSFSLSSFSRSGEMNVTKHCRKDQVEK